MKKIKNTEEALAIFKQYANMHGLVYNKGDYKDANKYHVIITNAVDYLIDNKSLIELSPFLNDESEGVKLWAAISLLPIMKDKAINTLKMIEQNKGLMSVTAHYKLLELGNNSNV